MSNSSLQDIEAAISAERADLLRTEQDEATRIVNSRCDYILFRLCPRAWAFWATRLWQGLGLFFVLLICIGSIRAYLNKVIYWILLLSTFLFLWFLGFTTANRSVTIDLYQRQHIENIERLNRERDIHIDQSLSQNDR